MSWCPGDVLSVPACRCCGKHASKNTQSCWLCTLNVLSHQVPRYSQIAMQMQQVCIADSWASGCLTCSQSFTLLASSLSSQTILGKTLAWLGLAWLGLAWLGLAWLGLAWLCKAELGTQLVLKPLAVMPHFATDQMNLGSMQTRHALQTSLELFDFSCACLART